MSIIIGGVIIVIAVAFIMSAMGLDMPWDDDYDD